MTAPIASSSSGVPIRWRTLEWWGAAIALFLMSGALFPLLMLSSEGGLDASARSKLQLLSLPSYCVALLLMARHWGQMRLVLRRNLPLVLLLTLPLLSVAWSIYPTITLKRAIGLDLSLALSFVLAIRFTPRQLLLLVAAALGVGLGLSVLLAGLSPHLAWMPDGAGMRGAYIHKNILGWYGAVGALVFAVLARDPVLLSRRISLPLLGIAIICLAASGSMTAILSAVAGAGFAAFYGGLARIRGTGRMLLVLLFLQVVALLLVAAADLLVPFLEAIGKDATLTGRVPLWALVDQEIRSRLFLGFGYQAFWTDANPEAWRIWAAVGWPAPHAHNGYRDTLLSLGVVGFVLLVVVLGRGVIQGARLLCRAPGEGWLWLNVLVTMMLVMNLTESNFLVQNDLLFVLLVTATVMFNFRLPEIRARS